MSYMLWIARASMVWAKRAALEVVKAELYDVIMCHSGCHTGTRLPPKVTIIEICVWRTCWQVLHALGGNSKHGVGQGGRLRGCKSGIV